MIVFKPNFIASMCSRFMSAIVFMLMHVIEIPE